MYGKVEVQFSALLPNKDRPFADRMSVTDFVIDIGSLAGKVCNEEFRIPNMIEHQVGDHILMFNIICTNCANSKLTKHLFECI